MLHYHQQSHIQAPAVWLPHSVESAVELIARLGSGARFISGGTLLQTQWENGHPLPDYLISLESISDLKEIHFIEEEDVLVIGALTSLANCQKLSLIKHIHPLLSEAVRFIAAPAVRTRGTIGGNIMGGIGDLIPLLVALKATLVFITPSGEERIDMWEWIQKGKGVEHTLLTKIIIPAMSDTRVNDSFFKKIGRRESFTAAIVTVSGMIMKTNLGTVDCVRLAAGGGENKPILLERTGELVSGKRVEEINWKAVYHSILDEFMPVTDAFVTADYRKKVAANLIITELRNRLIHEEGSGGGEVM